MAILTYALNINYNVGGQFASSIWHYTMDSGTFTNTALAAKGLCAGWNAANLTAMKNILSNQVTLLSLRARAINTTGGFEGQFLFPAATVGNRTGNLMAAGVGPVVILYPTANGKQRGRFFVPGISDNDAVDGIITAAFKTVLGTSMGQLISTFAAIGGGAPTAQPVVYSRKLRAAFNTGAAQTSPMLGQIRRRQVPA